MYASPIPIKVKRNDWQFHTHLEHRDSNFGICCQFWDLLNCGVPLRTAESITLIPRRTSPMERSDIGGSRGGGEQGDQSPLFLGWSPPFFLVPTLFPPPPKPHTEKQRSKSGTHEARYRLKRTPKHTKYAQI